MSKKRNQPAAMPAGAVRAEVTPEVTAEVAPEVTAEVTAEVAPEVTAEVTAEAAPEVTAEVAPEVAPYTVDAGKSITSKRGVLREGAAVTAKDLGGADAALAALVKAGYIVKNR